MFDRGWRAAIALCLLLGMQAAAGAGPDVAQAARAMAATHPELAPIEATGDFAFLIEQRRGYRALAEAIVQEHNPSASAAMRAPLDDFFAADAVATSLATTLDYPGPAGRVEAQLVFAADTRRLAIHRALRDFDFSRPPAGPMAIAEQRRELLVQVAKATGLPSRVMLQQDRLEWLMAALTDAVVPDAGRLAAHDYAASRGRAGVTAADLIDAWVAPALSGFGDDALRDFLSFARSEAGATFFGRLEMPHLPSAQPWYDEMVALVARHGRRAAARVDDVAALLADVDRALAGTVMAQDALALRARLLSAEAAAPRNADVQQRLGLLALWLRGPLETDAQLRADLPVAGDFKEADLRLAAALERDPSHAAALATQSRSYFFQHRDEEARRFLDRARKADPSYPWLDVYEADLLNAEGKYAEAVARYERIAAGPAPSGGVHTRSLMASRVAYVALGRSEDFVDAAMAHLVNNRNDHRVRALLAWHLIEGGKPDPRISRLLDALPEGPMKTALTQSASAQDLAARIDSGADAAATARTLLEAARASPGGVPAMVTRTCIERGGFERAALLAEVSGEKNALSNAIGCAVYHKDHERIAGLVKLGGDVNAASVPVFGSRPLVHAATHTNDIDAVRALLEAGADPALREPGGESLREQLAHSALDSAKAIVALLDANDPSAAAEAKKQRLARALENLGGASGLAARIDTICTPSGPYGDIDDALAVIEAGGVPEAEVTRLFGCSMRLREPPVELLARHGADLDAASVPAWPGTPLARAAEYDDVAMFGRLLAAGADPDKAFEGKSARQWLTERNSPAAIEMIELLDSHRNP